MRHLSMIAAAGLFIFLFCAYAHAQGDDWFCVNEAGKRSGTSIWACGVGDGLDEESARQHALDAAKREFQKICDLDDDCKVMRKTVNPQRMTCSGEPTGGLLGFTKWKCYRLLVVTLEDPN